MSITLDQQLTEVDRELSMRRRLYPQWVQRGTLNQATGDRQIATMEAVRETVRRARQSELMTSTLTGKQINDGLELAMTPGIGDL